jgi:hypothetical protein
MAYLQGVLADDHPLDEQAENLLPLLERRLVQPRPYPAAERRQVVEYLPGLGRFLPQTLFLFPLFLQGDAPLGQALAPLSQLSQAEHAGLVGVEQPLLLASYSTQYHRCLICIGPPLRVAVSGLTREALELSQQRLRVGQQLLDVPPDRDLQLFRLRHPLRARLVAGAADAVPPVALVVAPLGVAGRRPVGDAEHGQAAGAAGQQAPQQVTVPRVVAEGQRCVAAELLVRPLVRRVVDERWDGDGDPLGARPGAARGVLAAARPARARLPGRGEGVAVGVGRAGIEGVAEDAVDDGRRPAALAAARPPRAGVEPPEDLADRHLLIDQPAVEQAHQLGLGVIDHEAARRAVPAGDVAEAVGGAAADPVAGAGLLELAAAEALAEDSPLVLRDRPLDLQKELVVGVVGVGVLDEDDLTTGLAELFEQQRLVGVLAGQAVGAEDGDHSDGAVLNGVPEPVQGGPVQPGAGIAFVGVDVLGE